MEYGNERDIVLEISHAARGAQNAIEDMCSKLAAPHIVQKPIFGMDGNMYFFLKGDNIQNGIAGFGKTPEEAARAFDKAWFEG